MCACVSVSMFAVPLCACGAGVAMSIGDAAVRAARKRILAVGGTHDSAWQRHSRACQAA